MRHVKFPELPEDREYMCIGPHYWRRDKDAQTAIKECKRDFGSTRKGWKFILYDVPSGAKLDDMGDTIYYDLPKEGEPQPLPSREILRYEPPK
jgi:hypothetical protein